MELREKGLVEEVTPPLGSTLAVWTPSGGVTVADLADARYKRIAIANPKIAPFGRTAVAAMEAAGVYEALEPRLVTERAPSTPPGWRSRATWMRPSSRKCSPARAAERLGYLRTEAR